MDTFGENPEQITIKKVDGKVQVDFGGKTATVVTPDIIAKNGIIHEVDTILLSPETPIETTGNLIEVATKLGNFKKILQAIDDVGLTEEFKTIEAATVFAPSDKVFDELEVASPGIIGKLTKEQKIALISR